METNEESREKEITKVFDEIEKTLKDKCEKVVRGKYDTLTVDGVDVSYSGSYYMGRFGSQNKNWIDMTAWLGGETIRRRVQFEKFEIGKVIERVAELSEMIDSRKRYEESKEKEDTEWKLDTLHTFGEVAFPYSKDKDFELPVEEKTKDNPYPEYLLVRDGYDGFEIRRCGKGLTEKQLKRILSIIKEVKE